MTLHQFDHQNYLNLVTTRKNGQTVKTPVWFAQEGDSLLVWTEANSGKAKRIRKDGKVRVVPSTASGEPLGEWINGTAIVDSSPKAIQYVNDKFKKKYGLLFFAFNLLGKTRGAKYTTVRIRFD
jgi:PPOX class probable F420-dependent enzyme